MPGRKARNLALLKALDNGSAYQIVNTERQYLANLYKQLGFKRGAEIGVGGGVFSEMICQANPQVELWAVDAWQTYEEYPDFRFQEYLDKDYIKAQEKLKPYNVHIQKTFSMEAVQEFQDGFLDFVYVDGNHTHPWIDDDIREWSAKVREGGIVSGHDYIEGHTPVIEAVDSYVLHHRCGPLFLVGDPRENGSNEELILSWFWVR